jgi:hypothetical protein
VVERRAKRARLAASPEFQDPARNSERGSARWPGDADSFARRFASRLGAARPA